MTLALVGLFVACGGGDGEAGGSGDVSPSLGIEPFRAPRDSAVSADCGCRLERGLVGDLDQCTAELSPLIDYTLECLEQVAAQHAGVQENLDCAALAEENLAACLDGSSCSEAEYNACFFDSYSPEYADCPAITPWIFRELNDCF